MISVWILGDQLLDDHPALRDIAPDKVRVVLVESQKRSKKLRYHRKKLVLLFSAMRHYAALLEERGYTVDYYKTATFTEALKQHVDDHQTDKLVTMAAADYPGRMYQQDKLGDLLGIEVKVLPNTQFILGDHNPYPDPQPDKNYVMEHFYRDMRRHYDILMDDEKTPTGGEWNYDKQNRKSLPKKITLPDFPEYAPDAITQAVMDEVGERDDCVGIIDGFDYAVTHADAQDALQTFIRERMENFGPYEDAMTERGGKLFHAVLSPYINIGLLTPMQMIDAAETAYREHDAPINSVEGFIRQVLGWREYMYWQYWRQMPGMADENHWNGTRPMPQMFWDGKTEMNCIRHIVGRLQETGYSHHIERLMVVSAFCLMAGIQPKAVLEWFKAFYIDAYDWVMQPNVIGMGLNADGGKTATKPYIASANYINKMSDYCKGCAFKHTIRTGEGACPFNFLYWNFLIENEDELRSNPRTGRNVLNLRHLDDEEREQVKAQAQDYLENLDYYDG